MPISQKTLQQAVQYLSEALKRGEEDLRRLDAEIENLITLITGLVAAGRSDALKGIQPDIEKLYAVTRSDKSLVKNRDLICGQLRTLTTLVSLAADRVPAEPVAALVKRYLSIVRALALSEVPLDNQTIAKNANLDEATVARRLPELRSAGLVESPRDWRRKLNQLTPAGKEAAKAEGIEFKRKPVFERWRKFEPEPDIESLVACFVHAPEGPVDIERVASNLGVYVSREAVGRRGELVILKFADDDNVVVPVERADRDGRVMRYGMAKALSEHFCKGHHVSDVTEHVIGKAGFGKTSFYKGLFGARPDQHVSAFSPEMKERFARALLMPEMPLCKAWAEKPDQGALASEYNVPQDVFEERLRDLGFLKR